MINSIEFPLKISILQALFWGPMYAYGISKWIEKQTNCLVILQSKEITYYIKQLEKQKLVKFHKSKKIKGKTRGTVRNYYKITDEGRLAIIATREGLKMIFSDPPDELKGTTK